MAKKKTRESQYNDILQRWHGTNILKCDILGFVFPGNQIVGFHYATLTEHLRGYIYDTIGYRVIMVLPKNSPMIPRIKQIAAEHNGDEYTPNLKTLLYGN